MTSIHREIRRMAHLMNRVSSRLVDEHGQVTAARELKDLAGKQSALADALEDLLCEPAERDTEICAMR